MLHLAYSPLYSAGISPDARFPRARYAGVRELLEPARVAGRIAFTEPEPIDVADLWRVHDAGYVRAFLEGSLPAKEVRRIGIRPWTSAFVERALRLTGGTLAALGALAGGARVAGNVAGGTHHAHAAHGGGYCVFNDLALAARVALQEYGYRRVLIVDLDVHHGDGTAALFVDDPQVYTLSFHARLNYPRHKPPSDRDVAFEDDTRDAEYLAALERELPRALEAARPDLILYQAGVDALEADRLGRLSLSREGLQARNQLVFGAAATAGCPLLLTMGGGYGDPLEASVQAHADLFLQASELA
ncbi:MAG: histone deacetylase [Planctomycetota bacterium]